MSYYSTPSRLYDINSNKKSEPKSIFTFDNTYNKNNNNNSYNNNNNGYTSINNNSSSNHNRYSSLSDDASTDGGNNSGYFDTAVSENTHNTSGYSSGFEDVSYSSNNSILHDNDAHHNEHVEANHEVEYSRAPDTFPCGHILCHNCVRKFMRMRRRSGYSSCPVCHTPIYEDISLQAMGLAVSTPNAASTPTGFPSPTSPIGFPSSPSLYGPPPPTPSPSDPTPISLLTNFDEMVKKFTGFDQGYYGLRRLKDESVKSKSMGMTFTNTQCHLCYENHGTLRVVQEYNKLSVKHERPNVWSNYFYRLQQGKVVTEFHSMVNSSCICVPCTYKELKARNLPELKALPNVDPSKDTRICLAEVGKILAKNSAPIMALQGKNVIEIEHTLQLRQRADQFDFLETADQVERLVKQQEEMLLNIASRQIRDTGRLYHVKESNSVEYDLDETDV